MNILYTITSYPPAIGGTQLHTHLLAQELQKLSHKVQVASHWDNTRTDWLLGTTLWTPSDSKSYEIDGIAVQRLGFSIADKLRTAPYLPLYFPLMDMALPPIARQIERHLLPIAQNVDLIHNIRQGREGLAYASLAIARKLDVPFVFTPTHHPRWTGWIYRAYLNLYRSADLVIALTNTEKEILIRLGVEDQRIAVTGIGPVVLDSAEPEAFRKKHKIEGPIVLFLARKNRYKGYFELLQATKLVWQKLSEVNFVFIGPAVGNSDQVFDSFHDSRIYNLGNVDLQEKTNALSACDVLCVPSTQESFGGVYTEAWTFSKPVIGCNIPSVSEVISDGVDGYLVEQNAAQIAERLCELLKYPQLATSLGAAGHQKVKERFTWDKLAELTEQAYLKTIRCSSQKITAN